MTMNAHWFRSHHGAPTDPKWLIIAKRSETQPIVTVGIWWSLLDYASQNEDRGSIAGYDSEAIAEFYSIDHATMLRVLDVLRERGMINDDRLTNWDKRQPKREDDSTERVRRHRAAKATEGNGEKRSVTHGNARGEERRVEEKRETTTTKPSAAAASVADGVRDPETPDRRKEPRRRSRSAAVPAEKKPERESWLTPAKHAWEKHNGAGSFPEKQAAGLLSRLAKAGLTEVDIGRRLDRYCSQRKAGYCTLADFAQHHGQYAPPPLESLRPIGGEMSAELERETRPPGFPPPAFPLPSGMARIKGELA